MAELWNDLRGDFRAASIPDYLPLDRLRQLQWQRLKSVLEHVVQQVPVLRKRYQEAGVDPLRFRDLADLAELPFIVKTDLRDHYPFGLFASPMREIVRVHASSGTTGKPIVVAYTQEDLNVWSSVMVRTFAACGVHQGDILQNSFGYGLFTGGLGAHYGAEALGATVIPMSGGNTDRQIMLMQDFGVTVLCSTPSYFIHLLERAGELGVDCRTSPLRVGIFGAEPWTGAMRDYIQRTAGIKAYDIYGLSEIIGPGVASECVAQNGLHIFEDHFYPEIIDPVSGKVLPDGSEGELVLTTLSKRAMPMLRYRTRDITSLSSEPCSCGRTLRRIRRISRRSDDMFIIRGINVFPSQVEPALLAVEGTLPHYQIVLTREHGLDRMEVQVEVTRETFTDDPLSLEALRRKLIRSLEATLGLHVEVRLVEPHTLARSEGKAKRVFDRRNMDQA